MSIHSVKGFWLCVLLGHAWQGTTLHVWCERCQSDRFSLRAELVETVRFAIVMAIIVLVFGWATHPGA